MKFLFLSLLVCILIFNADSLSILQPGKQMSLLEKLKADPEAFVSEMSEADPLIVEQVLALLNGLLDTSETREGVLVDHLDKKKKALDDANARVVAAQAVVDQAVKDQQAANAAVAGADAAVTAANLDLATKETAQAQAQTEKDDSQKGHDNEIDGLNDDQSILRQVIELLTKFLTSSPTQSPTASPTTQSPTTQSPTASPTTPSPTASPTTLSLDICPNGNGPDDTAGWQLVRRVHDQHWHPATDNLAGSEVYGTFVDDPQAPSTFSRKFDDVDFNQFMFISGDCDRWLIATKQSVNGEFYKYWYARLALSSSFKPYPYWAIDFTNSESTAYNPYIQALSHYPVYAEDSYQGHAHMVGRRNGFNVLIRKAETDVRYSCPRQSGYCVLPNGNRQLSGVITLDRDIDQLLTGLRDEERRNGHTVEVDDARHTSCLTRCLAYPGATGCEEIWDQSNAGCYIHTHTVDRGDAHPSEIHRHACWIFSECTRAEQPVVNGWTLLYRQTVPFVQPIDDWHHYNENDPDDPNFSILDQLERYRSSDGKFELKLVWPQKTGKNYNWWKQTSNPTEFNGQEQLKRRYNIKHQGVRGYEAVDVAHVSADWGGLEYSGDGSLSDGSVSSSYHPNTELGSNVQRWYSVGVSDLHEGALPGPGTGEQEIELWVHYS